MISFPNAKINIGLRITRRRPDGYHDLETLFLPIAIYDALEVGLDPTLQETVLTESGLAVGGDPHQHLCFKAWQLMKGRHPGLPHLRIHLHKTIPMGAGLGGGSADGAFTLMAINRLLGLGMDQLELAELALELGSDCPFFILNKPALARGRGEILVSRKLDLSGYELVLVHPGIHTSTRQAFEGIVPSTEGPALEDSLGLPVESWRGRIVNDFEKSIFSAEPRIASIRDLLYDQGAVFASLTGSGSAVYGLFRKGQSPVIRAEQGWQVFQPEILG